MMCRKIDSYSFEVHGDERGSLVALEALKNIPFEIKRVYYMYGTSNDAIRGCHAHKNLEQVLICVHGSCRIALDDGNEKKTIVLDEPNEGLYISGEIWREMYDFSEDAVLMVLASDYYNENDYLRDYDDFMEYIRHKKPM